MAEKQAKLRAEELRKALFQEDRRHINTGSDTEVLINILAHEVELAGREQVADAPGRPEARQEVVPRRRTAPLQRELRDIVVRQLRVHVVQAPQAHRDWNDRPPRRDRAHRAADRDEPAASLDVAPVVMML